MGNLISSCSMVNPIRQVLKELAPAVRYQYPTMTKTIGKFKFRVTWGEFTESQIVLIQGAKGTGKTTFMHLLAGSLRPDSVEGKMPEFNASYKPQKISPMSEGSIIVRELLQQRIPDAYTNPQFVSDVMQPLRIQQLMQLPVVNLSYGQLQRLELCLCLGKPADIYLIDEPGVYLDSEERMVVVEVIQRFILHSRKTAFVISEHDFKMAYYLYDRAVIVCKGKPSIDCIADYPKTLLTQSSCSRRIRRRGT